MYRICKRFRFEAAHSLDHLPAAHKCHRKHGHSYQVEVVVTAFELDHRGFAGLDYAELDELRQHIDADFDHRDLNEVMGDSRETTAETLAQYFFDWCQKRWRNVDCVRVSETADTWVEFRGD